MDIPIKLAEFGSSGIAIALIIAVVYVSLKLSKMFSIMIMKLNKSIDANTNISNETAKYLKNKNGQMEECFRVVMKHQEKHSETLDRVTNKLDNIDKRYINSKK